MSVLLRYHGCHEAMPAELHLVGTAQPQAIATNRGGMRALEQLERTGLATRPVDWQRQALAENPRGPATVGSARRASAVKTPQPQLAQGATPALPHSGG